MKARITLILFLFSTCGVLFSQSADQLQSINRGKVLYQGNCNACHMVNGEGLKGVFPPLAGNEHINNTNFLVKVVLKGIRGTVTVNGVEYNMPMTPFRFSDQETADLINYIRFSWGQKDGLVKPAEIQPALQAKTPGYEPY